MGYAGTGAAARGSVRMHFTGWTDCCGQAQRAELGREGGRARSW